MEHSKKNRLTTLNLSGREGTFGAPSDVEMRSRRKFIKGAAISVAALATVPPFADNIYEVCRNTTPQLDPVTPHIPGKAQEMLTNCHLSAALWGKLLSGEPIGDAPITIPCESGTRSFACVPPGNAYCCYPDPKTGAKIVALREVDPKSAETFKTNPEKPLVFKNELRIICLGRMKKPEEIYGNNPQDKAATHELLEGRRSPQIASAETYYHDVLKPYLRANDGLNVKLFGHSLGAGNAMHLKYLMESEPHAKPVETMFYEPYALTQEVVALTKDKPENNSEEFVRRCRTGITYIYALPLTAISRCINGGNAIYNKPFGEHILILDAKLDSGYVDSAVHQDAIVGAKKGAAAGAALGVAKTMHDAVIDDGMSWQQLLKQAGRTAIFAGEGANVGVSIGRNHGMTTDISYHMLEKAVGILHDKGDRGLLNIKITNDICASPTEILHSGLRHSHAYLERVGSWWFENISDRQPSQR